MNTLVPVIVLIWDETQQTNHLYNAVLNLHPSLIKALVDQQDNSTLVTYMDGTTYHLNHFIGDIIDILEDFGGINNKFKDDYNHVQKWVNSIKKDRLK